MYLYTARAICSELYLRDHLSNSEANGTEIVVTHELACNW